MAARIHRSRAVRLGDCGRVAGGAGEGAAEVRAPHVVLHLVARQFCAISRKSAAFTRPSTLKSPGGAKISCGENGEKPLASSALLAADHGPPSGLLGFVVSAS